VPVAGGHTVWLWSGREARGTHPSLGMSVERVAHPNRSVAGRKRAAVLRVVIEYGGVCYQDTYPDVS
jgi:hypothetical protein